MAGGFDYTKEDLSDYSGSQQNFEVESHPGDQYVRNGRAVYFFGGYLYTYRMYNNSTKTLLDPINDVTYSYQPKNVFPRSYNGVELGIGKELNQYIDVQAAYIQQFQETMSGSLTGGQSYSSSVRMSALLGDVGFVLNPDDEFQVMLKLGALASQTTYYVNVSNTSAYVNNDSTQINPAAGVDLIWQFDQNAAFRLSTLYVAETQSSYTDGDIQAFAGFSYSI